ncbi:MAG: DUF1351 domain-containing protein [Bacilli bacterium]
MNEIAVVNQLPKITDKIKEIGENLDKRLEKLNLDNLICSEETRKEITELRTVLKKEQTEYETQRKNIKNEILKPYEEFNKIYDENIKSKYDQAINVLSSKIVIVENTIKENTLSKMVELFEEYREANLLKSDWLKFDELNIKLGINQLTPKGELIKKVKDEIIEKITKVKTEIDTIATMEYHDEILVEYIKNKDLGQAIRIVNDRHMILETIKQSNQEIKQQEEVIQESIRKVDKVLQSPIEEEKLYTVKFSVTSTKEKLTELKKFLVNGGYKYE